MKSLITACAISALALCAGAQAQTLATRHVMEEKLARSERILESLMMSDFETLQRESEALSHLTEEPGWMVLNTPEYRRYSSAFVNALTYLVTAARERDLDAAMVHYTSMTVTCYQCHRYLKDSRITNVLPVADTDGDGQKPQNRQPPAKPSPPPKAVPRTPPRTPAPVAPRAVPRTAPRTAPRVEIYPYPFVFGPDLMYRFPYGLHPYYRWGYPYAPYVYSVPPQEWIEAYPTTYGSVEFDVTPGTAAVFVDGYYAGTLDNLEDGNLLHLVPGPHHIDIEAPGLQPVSFDVNVQANQTIKYRATLQPGANGSTEEGRSL